MGTRAAVYYRVSSDSQSIECQRPEVEQLCRARGLHVVASYEEQASAAKRRPEHERMMKDAKKGKFNVLVIWAIDRFGRSMVGNLGDVLELDRIGVEVVSVRESWLDTGGPVRALLIAIFSWVAQEERARLIERTKAGMIAARKRGAKIGRPRVRVDRARLLDLRARGLSVREIAAEMKVAVSTIQRRLRAVGGQVVRLQGAA
jgi:putative DNA-invertase from lambdoid prophage Rac